MRVRRKYQPLFAADAKGIENLGVDVMECLFHNKRTVF
jgi:hypothetical protein